MAIYRVILMDGKEIPIDADKVGWQEKLRCFHFYKKGRLVAEFNYNNIVGWVEGKYELP